MKYPLGHFSHQGQPVAISDLRDLGIPSATINALKSLSEARAGR